MGDKIKSRTLLSAVVIFAVMIAVHGFEAIVLRMDETVLGENFINKVFGIIAVIIILRMLGWKPWDIGFSKKGILKGLCTGLLLGAAAFTVAYTLEAAILKSGGSDVSLGIFTSGFSLTGEAEIHTGAGFILMCIFFNIINVIMEEGTFRGLFWHIACIDHSERCAMFFQALLFGIWHIVTPLHNYIDKDLSLGGFVGLSVGYIILAGLMGIKWSMLYRMTGNLYAGMADHFFNNCIATNLLHVVTQSGTDEMMIVRVMTAQFLSFAAVAIAWKKRAKKPMPLVKYDPDTQYPAIRSSICTGEKVAGFRNSNDGHFTEVMLIKGPDDEKKFKEMYGLDYVRVEY
ncbi:MAG: CPBP family intramembrane metalloprotease [Lachnospiraceae bacterium]|nr:CPBP family intramembrane metalloprotease [Lachnospiraceae bacterium]